MPLVQGVVGVAAERRLRRRRRRAQEGGVVRVAGAHVAGQIAGDVGAVGAVRARVWLLARVCPHVPPQERGVIRPAKIPPTHGARGHARAHRGPRGRRHAHQPRPRCHQPLQQHEGSLSQGGGGPYNATPPHSSGSAPSAFRTRGPWGRRCKG